MFYVVSKLIWFVLQPTVFLLLLITLGAFMLWRGRIKLGKIILGFGLISLLILALSPLGHWIAQPLEDRFPRTQNLKDIDGIIVLGGSIRTLITEGRGAIELGEAGDRVVEAIRLAKQMPTVPVIFTGGSTKFIYKSESESLSAIKLFTDLGLDKSRIILEGDSLNTRQNADYTKQLLGNVKDKRYLLITSAFHMPRAIGCFRASGINVSPWPVDYRSRGKSDFLRPDFVPSRMLNMVDVMSKEWLGLIAYGIFGYTSELFPARSSTLK
jgi:uncharacterized SAM-binding protein YcdF (DUF218 family)